MQDIKNVLNHKKTCIQEIITQMRHRLLENISNINLKITYKIFLQFPANNLSIINNVVYIKPYLQIKH